MSHSLLAVSAVTPALLLMWYFHSRDVFPEPRPVLWKTFFLGVLTVLPVVAIGWPLFEYVYSLPSPYLQGFVHAFGLAAIPEELCKFLVLYLYCVRHHEFNEPMDGIVYGVAVSLGFATLENVLFVASGGFEIALARAITAVPCHAFLGAIMGYYLGQSEFHPERKSADFAKALAIPILIHGLYDLPLLTVQAMAYANPGADEVPGRWLLAGVPLILGGLFVASVASVNRLRLSQKLRLHTTPPPPAPPLDRYRGWWLVAVGAILTTAGGIIFLGVIHGVVTDRVEPSTAAWIRGLALGLLPALVGAKVFGTGLRRLGCRAAS